jgi:hypothetical protein
MRNGMIGIFCCCLLACQPQLERQGVPLVLGIQLDANSACSLTSWQKNSSLRQQFPQASWLVELPIHLPEKQGQPPRMASLGAFQQAMDSLAGWEVPLYLHVLLENPFRWQKDSIPWDNLATKLEPYLLSFWDAAGQEVFFSGIWVEEKRSREKWSKQLQGWQTQGLALRTALAGRPEVLLDSAFSWPSGQVIGIINDAPADLAYKPYFRRRNRALSQKALATGSPLLILQSNLYGNDRLLLFKNQLRFWHEEVELLGITVNSLYCHNALAEPSPRYGLQAEQELKAYLQAAWMPRQ